MLQLNLQRFAGEKTERATPRRRQEARREGRIPRSPELTSAVTLVALLVGLRLVGGRILSGWTDMMQQTLGNAATADFTQQSLIGLLDGELLDFVKLILPLIAIALVVGVLVSFMQVGAVFLPNHLVPDFNRINPVSGFRRLFSLKSSVEALKSLLKLAVVGLVAYMALHGSTAKIAMLGQVSINSYPSVVGQIVFQMGIEISILMVLIGALDFMFQRFEFEKSIRMSRQDIKDEMKQQEGDPLVRGRIRQRGRAIAMQRMMAAVPKADVIVTNPTHFAVALQYDASKNAAPVVVAKGSDELARRIRQAATDAGVPIVENKPLAQTLWKTVEIGEAIPDSLYQAVAQVLAYVYRLKGSRR